MTLITPFLIGNAGATALLVVGAASRKARRDRRERTRHGHQQDLRHALLAGGDELETVFRHVARHPQSQLDLAVVLPAVVAEHHETLVPTMRAVAVQTGLAQALERRLHHRRATVRGSAAMLVGQLRLDHGAEGMRHLLVDRDGDVQLVTAGALWRLATPEAADALVDALAARTMPAERLIERLGTRWATPVILARLARAGDDRPMLRSGLARALGLSGDQRGEPALLELLANGSLEERVCATRALGSCGTSTCHPSLLRALDDIAWEVRAQAATALAALDVAGAVPALAANLTDRSWWLRANAAAALSRLGEDGIAALRRAAEGDDPYAAEQAIEALALSGNS